LNIDDVLALVGVLLVAAGLLFIYWPIALLFVGGAAIAAGVLRART
jgi:hypothetical protein